MLGLSWTFLEHRLVLPQDLCGCNACLSTHCALAFDGGGSLVWTDASARPHGSAPDSAKWTYDVGASKWGNDELETYMELWQNSRMEGDKLILEAHKEFSAGSAGMLSACASAPASVRDTPRVVLGRSLDTIRRETAASRFVNKMRKHAIHSAKLAESGLPSGWSAVTGCPLKRLFQLWQESAKQIGSSDEQHIA